MAGRDQRKLESLRAELAARINPAVKDVPILVADAMDSSALGEVVKQTQVWGQATGVLCLRNTTRVQFKTTMCALGR
jgi:hypothetical protein